MAAVSGGPFRPAMQALLGQDSVAGKSPDPHLPAITVSRVNQHHRIAATARSRSWRARWTAMERSSVPSLA